MQKYMQKYMIGQILYFWIVLFSIESQNCCRILLGVVHSCLFYIEHKQKIPTLAVLDKLAKTMRISMDISLYVF